MNRIAQIFQNTQPFIGYLTGGDGGLEYTVACALALIAGGVDILEIGFPFSDPIADGPVIQKAHERSLAQGTTSAILLEIAKRVRQVSDIPLILFSYYNPILQKGNAYLHQLKASGFDAVLIVDLTDSDPYFKALEEANLLPILLATPSTNSERLLKISAKAQGFLYYASQKGTTGVRKQLANDFTTQIKRLRPYFKIPIAVGFGIADRASAQSALEYADGFVVGSAFVQKMEAQISPHTLTQFVQAIDPRKR